MTVRPTPAAGAGAAGDGGSAPTDPDASPVAQGSDSPFTLTQLRYFVAAADAASMTEAARILMVSQSAVSSATAALERQLGVQLLVRHHARGLSLTRSGERFLREARGFLAHAAELGDSARGLGSGLAGPLSVGCFASLAPFYLPRLLQAFSTAHPGVTVEIVEGESQVLRRALLDGRCEVALLYDLGLGDDIVAEPLATAPPYLAVSARHRLAGAGPVALADVADDSMVLLDLPHSRDYFLGLARAEGFVPQVRYRSTNFETVRALVAWDFGYSILNQRPKAARTYDGGRVVAVAIAGAPTPLPIVLAVARGVRPTTRARAWAALCREQMPGLATVG